MPGRMLNNDLFIFYNVTSLAPSVMRMIYLVNPGRVHVSSSLQSEYYLRSVY